MYEQFWEIWSLRQMLFGQQGRLLHALAWHPSLLLFDDSVAAVGAAGFPKSPGSRCVAYCVLLAGSEGPAPHRGTTLR